MASRRVSGKRIRMDEDEEDEGEVSYEHWCCGLGRTGIEFRTLELRLRRTVTAVSVEHGNFVQAYR
jgi:hypothetical protein